MAKITFSPAVKPGVFVNQFIISTAATTPSRSSLPALIIGPKYNIIKDELAGVYSGDQTDIFFPKLEAGAKVLKDSVKIILKNIILAIIASGFTGLTIRSQTASATTSMTGSTLTDTAATFTTGTAVVAGDTVNISYTVGLDTFTISAKAVTVTATTILVDKALPTIVAPNISYSVAQDVLRNETSSATSSITGSTLTDTAAAFTTGTALAVNDTVNISYTVGLQTFTIVAKAVTITATTIVVDKALPTVASPISYSVTRNTGLFSGSFGALNNILTTNFAGDFSDVFPNDIVKITHPTQGTVNATVTAVTSTSTIKLNKSFTNTGNVGYVIERANANRVAVLGQTAGTFTTLTTTDLLQDLSGTGFSTVQVGDLVRIIKGTVIETATVIGLIDTYTIQLSKTFASGNITFSITRMQTPNAPFQLTDDLSDYVLNDTDSDTYVDNKFFTINGSLSIADLDGAISIKTSDVYVDYRALSVAEANTVIEVDNAFSLNKVGELDYTNPLGLAVSLAVANTLNTVYAIPLEDNTNEAWLKALSVAEGQRANNLCMLSQSMTIQSFGKTHVDGMSIASRHGWRFQWMNLKHVFEEVLVTQQENGRLEYIPDINGDYIRFFSALGDFSAIPATDTYIAFWKSGTLFDSNDKPVDPTFYKVTEKGDDDNVLICDKFAYIGEQGRGVYTAITAESSAEFTGYIYDPTEKTFTVPTANTTASGKPFNGITFNVGDYAVINDQDPDFKANGVYIVTQVGTVTEPFIFTKDDSKSAIDAIDINGAPTSLAPQVGIYQIIKLLDKTEQAQAIANVAHSFGNRKILYITNEKCIIELDGIDRTLPGYYVCAAYAGLASASSVPPHQPFTNFPIAGIKAVLYSSADRYFSPDQQGIVVAGGGWLCEQSVFGSSPVMAWQQVTTDNSSVSRNEFSFSRNLDDISYKFYDDHIRFPGISNNIEDARNFIATQTAVTLDQLTKNPVDSTIGGKLGTQAISTSFSGIQADPLLPIASYADIDLVLPLPLNLLTFNLRAQGGV